LLHGTFGNGDASVNLGFTEVGKLVDACYSFGRTIFNSDLNGSHYLYNSTITTMTTITTAY